MKKALLHSRGFLTIEIILAAATFSLFVMAYVGTILYGEEAGVLAGQRARATYLAEEGYEAVRNMRDEDFSNLADGTYGLLESGSQWTLSDSEDVTDIFTRQVEISSVDENRKAIVSTVTWQQNALRPGSAVIEGQLTNWQRGVATSTP